MRKLATADRVPQDLVSALEGVQQVPHPRGGDRQGAAALPAGLHAQAELQLPGHHPLPGRGLQRLQLGLVVRRPEVLDVPPPPPRQVHDLNAVAPDLVFTVLTYGTSPLHGPPLVRNFSSPDQPTRRPPRRTIGYARISIRHPTSCVHPNGEHVTASGL